MYFLQTRTFSRLYLGAHKVHVHPQVDVRKLWHRTIPESRVKANFVDEP